MIEAGALADALKVVKPAVGARSHLPVLSGVKLEADGERLSITGSDIDLTIEAHAPCGTEFECVLPYAPLAAFAGKVSGAVVVEVGDTVTLEAGNARLSLRPYAVDDWPELAHAQGDEVKLDADTTDRLSRIVHAASTNAAKPVQCGVKLGPGEAAAADGYRLAVVDTPDLPDLIVPATLLSALIAEAEGGAILAGDGRRVTFRSGSSTWTARTIPGDYPAYKRLIPESSPMYIVAQREELLAAAALVATMRETKEGRVRLDPAPGELTVRAAQQDLGEIADVIVCDTDFDEPIAFNAGNLTDALRTLREDEVRIEVTSPMKPALMREGPLRLLLMPKKISP